MLSRMQWERISAADISRLQTEARLEEITGDWKESQKLVKERQEALFEAMAAAREKHPEGDLPAADQRSLFKIEDDYRRALDKHELKDREKRRTSDLAAKLGERVFNLLKDSREEEDLYTKNDPAVKGGMTTDQAIGGVLIADIVEVQIAQPLTEMGILTLNDLCKISEKALFDIDKKIMGYVHFRLAEYLKPREAELEKKSSLHWILDNAPPKCPDLRTLTLDIKPAKAPEVSAEAATTGDVLKGSSKDHEGTLHLNFIEPEGVEGFSPGLFKSWWFKHASENWEKKYPLAKAGPILAELDAANAPTAYAYLRLVEGTFRAHSDKRKAIDALPDMPKGVLGSMVVDVQSAAHGESGAKLRQLLVNIAKANIDAFIELFGKDSPINAIRIQAEHEDDAETSKLNGKAPKPDEKPVKLTEHKIRPDGKRVPARSAR